MKSLLALVSFVLLCACSSAPAVKEQKYAKMLDHRTFEYEFPVVWKGIENVVHNYKITDRDPDEVDATELKKLTKRTLQTDWIYAQSRDKYIEYKVNDSPRKKYLQTRVKYKIQASTVIGGVDVKVNTQEEIERLKEDGTPSGYDKAEDIDTSRPNEVLEKINLAILGGGP